MQSRTKDPGDDRNTGFGASRTQDAKPGYEAAEQQQEERSDLHHRRRASDEKEIPQGTLAERIRRDRQSEAS